MYHVVPPPSPPFQSTKGALATGEDQEKLLAEALSQVKKNSFEMKTCLVRGAVLNSLLLLLHARCVPY